MTFVWRDDDVQWDDLRAAGGPGSGHFGHAGRPGQIGGSAPGAGLGSDADFLPFETLGFPISGPEMYARIGVESEIAISTTSGWSAETPLAKEAMAGIREALTSDPELAALLRGRLQVTFTNDPEEPGAMITVINNKKPGPLGLIINTAKSPKERLSELLGADPSLTVIGKMLHERKAQGASEEELMHSLWRGVTTHEMGHMVDSIYNEKTGTRVSQQVKDWANAGASYGVFMGVFQIHDEQFGAWMEKTVSRYAAFGGPPETWAEIYMARRFKFPLPPEAEKLVDDILAKAIPRRSRPRVTGGPRGRTLEGV